MSNFRNRPKGKFIQQAEWSQLLGLIENYNSELIYFKFDLRLLVKLIDVHLSRILLIEDIEEVRTIQSDLTNSINDCDSLMRCIPLHKSHLKKLVHDPTAYDSYIFRCEHQLLEDDIIACIDTLKALKLIAQTLINNALCYIECENAIWKYN